MYKGARKHECVDPPQCEGKSSNTLLLFLRRLKYTVRKSSSFIEGQPSPMIAMRFFQVIFVQNYSSCWKLKFTTA